MQERPEADDHSTVKKTRFACLRGGGGGVRDQGLSNLSYEGGAAEAEGVVESLKHHLEDLWQMIR
jgi:hypothetical protein